MTTTRREFLASSTLAALAWSADIGDERLVARHCGRVRWTGRS
ncbi:MAG: hypothetical protein WD801_10800 [Gemmatimonadaceae bacterium]